LSTSRTKEKQSFRESEGLSYLLTQFNWQNRLKWCTICFYWSSYFSKKWNSSKILVMFLNTKNGIQANKQAKLTISLQKIKATWGSSISVDPIYTNIKCRRWRYMILRRDKCRCRGIHHSWQIANYSQINKS
jgi:hypothetical protein